MRPILPTAADLYEVLQLELDRYQVEGWDGREGEEFYRAVAAVGAEVLRQVGERTEGRYILEATGATRARGRVAVAFASAATAEHGFGAGQVIARTPWGEVYRLSEAVVRGAGDPSGTVEADVEAVATGFAGNVDSEFLSEFYTGVELTAVVGDGDELLAAIAAGEVSVAGVTDATGGADALLDLIGLGRGLPRASGEGDVAYRVRLRSMPDLVSPGAFRRAFIRALAPWGLTPTLYEPWSYGFAFGRGAFGRQGPSRPWHGVVSIPPGIPWQTHGFAFGRGAFGRAPIGTGDTTRAGIFAGLDALADALRAAGIWISVRERREPAALPAWAFSHAVRTGTEFGVVAFGSEDRWNLSGPRTVVAWVRLIDTPTSVYFHFALGTGPLSVVGLTLGKPSAFTSSGTVRRSVQGDTALSDGWGGSWHQVIVSWRQDTADDAKVYVDGVEQTLDTNSVASPVDIANGLTVGMYAISGEGEVYVAEVAALRVIADATLAAALWNDGEPLDVRTVGATVLDYFSAAASDDEGVTYKNLAAGSWARSTATTAPLERVPLPLVPPWLTGYLDCNGTVWAEAAGAMTGIATPWTRIVVCSEESGGYQVSSGVGVEIYRDDDTWKAYWTYSDPPSRVGDGAETSASGTDSGATGLRAVAASRVSATDRAIRWAGAATDGEGSDTDGATFNDVDVRIANSGAGASATGARIYADLVIQGTPTVTQLRALLTTPPWQVFTPADILRCYIPALAYVSGPDVIIPDVAQIVGGPLVPVNAVMQDGGLDDIVIA